ncbi:hypothetical protein ACFPK9_07615 [Rubritalea spongiae]|uniref:DUF1570 domain-containing protein n=1 Tax=Rubritalea spongiae TaxID=430797 RepID=A0ABW5E2R8_9BACT
MLRIFPVLLVWLLSLLSSYAVQKFTIKDSRTLTGHIRYVVAKQAYIVGENGVTYKVALKDLDPQSLVYVNGWIRSKGGDDNYASWIDTSGRGFSASWPRTVYAPTRIDIQAKYQEFKKGHYVYESTHYRFVSDAKLEPKVVQRFAVLFETTYEYVMELPLNASGRYLEKEEKFKIYLFGNYRNYVRAGGSPGSAGVYLPRTQMVMVPLEMLGLEDRGGEWVYVKDVSNKVLAHELQHQLTGGTRFPAWYIEGSAEYVASTRYTHGAYHVVNGKTRMFDYVRDKDGLADGSGRRLGGRIAMMPLEQFMDLNYQNFSRGRVHENYAVALMLTYFFYHEDGNGDAAGMKAYIKALQKGKVEKEARKHLLRGRTHAELQEQFRRFCSTGGIAVEFP